MSIIDFQKDIEGRSRVEELFQIIKKYPETRGQFIDHCWLEADVEVYTLLSIDVFGEIEKRESFYLSVYQSADDRDDDAIAWLKRQRKSGCHVIRINGLGEVNRI